MYSLRMHSWLDNISGVLVGRSAAPIEAKPEQLNDLDALQGSLSCLSVPVIYDVDIDHVPPQFSLVNGARASVVVYQSRGKLKQRLQA
ncbi:S66 peptidase family protein [Biostraticola tofi]|uniref:hypothetical protein n=1 Tax=Biostraticola tofi TaxID=466109 RepID=UPI0022A84200